MLARQTQAPADTAMLNACVSLKSADDDKTTHENAHMSASALTPRSKPPTTGDNTG